MNHHFGTLDGDNGNTGSTLEGAFRDITFALGRMDDGYPLGRGGVYRE